MGIGVGNRYILDLKTDTEGGEWNTCPLRLLNALQLARMNRGICVLIHVETIERDGQFRTELAEKGDLYISSHD